MATESLSEEVTFKLDCGMGWCQACEESGKGGVPGRRKSCAETLGREELIILLKNREGSRTWRAGCRGGGCEGRAGEWSRQSGWSSFELGKDVISSLLYSYTAEEDVGLLSLPLLP